MNKQKSSLVLLLLTFLTSTAFASQGILFANNLYNSVPSSAGATESALTVNFYTGSSVLCDTRIVPYGSFVTVVPGATGSDTGSTSCTSSQLITSVTATPITSIAAVGAVYGTSAVSYSVTNSTTSTQITATQSDAPVFDASNGAIATAGTFTLS